MSNPNPTRWFRRSRFAPVAIIAGVGATAAIALSMNGTLAAFTAQITNSTNQASTGTLIMQETQTVGGTTTTCTSTDGTNFATNSATCATINKYGGATNLVPGGTSTGTATITNTGTADATTFTLTPQACQQLGTVTGVSATDLCAKLTIKIDKTVNGTTTNVVAAGTTLNALNTAGVITFAGGQAANSVNPTTFTFTVTFPSGLGNSYQGLTAKQGLVWNFSAGN